MERLTEEKQIGPFAALKDKAEAVPGAFGSYDCLYAHMVAVTRLKEYEDTGIEPEEVKEHEAAYIEIMTRTYGPIHEKIGQWLQAEKDGRLVVLPPSDPLALEQLREMDGEPVWVEALDYGVSRWAFVAADCEVVRYFTTRSNVACDVIARQFKTYGKTWLAYRRKPEEGTTA